MSEIYFQIFWGGEERELGKGIADTRLTVKC